MYSNSKTPPSKMRKRPFEGSSSERQRKIPFDVVDVENDALEEKLFQFRILLPNGTTIELKLSEQRSQMPVEEFIYAVRNEYHTVMNQRRSPESKKRINWECQDLHFTDAHSNKIRTRVNLRDFTPNKWHFLCLNDGSTEPDAYEGMWDLTPDTELFKELPDDYTFETALADLIDNSLQALWSNRTGERRLISIELLPNRISIFDSGPGMDGANGNLVKWGKMGASLHRSVRGKAIGGEPPYLMPYFGMFGYGGPVATMCLGKRAVVSSKTKTCNKVFTLHLEREALVSASRSENCWKTKGGMGDPSEDEKENSPHGSFTKVQIFEPKVKSLDIKRFRCKLKDIYFPYIQCDEVSGKTSTPIEFKVNGIDLTEIEGGEVATTYLHSCNGPDFILQLHFSINQDSSSMAGQSQGAVLDANARLKCVYFPMFEGEENIKRILDKLDADGCGIRESFESFSRVSVRRLGRLLPDTRWALLPFMEPKLKIGEKGQSLKRKCSRVKCFIAMVVAADTDSGFNPTPHKTDLAHHHPYTKALKNFGNREPKNEKEVQVEIFRNGKKLTPTDVQKQYYDWISEMHDHYDDEIDDGLDQPILVVVSSKIKKLDISSDVVRVHKQIQRKGKIWSAGQNIKVLRGACGGCHKNNVYATLEYIILQGLQGDACGEARLICRPLGMPEDKGCRLLVRENDNMIDIRESLVLPIRIIDSEKCIPVDGNEWANKLEAHSQKLPSAIDLLSPIECQELEIEGGLPTVVEAGDAPPENVVAVIRPKSFNSKNNSKRMDQKFIVRDNLQMSLEIKSRSGEKSGGECTHIFSIRISPSSHKGIHGLYVFPLREKSSNLFKKAGLLTLSFSLSEPRDIRLQQIVQVEASAEVGRWKIVNLNRDEFCTVRAGSCFTPLQVACFDKYNNRVPFTSIPKLTIKLISNGVILAEVRSKRVEIIPKDSTLTIKEFFVRSSRLDDIRPNYEATLNISTLDEAFSAAFPCRVLPGAPGSVILHPPNLSKRVTPGQIIEEFALEVFDEYGNHAKEDDSILLRVDGFSFEDGSGIIRRVGMECRKKVDANGYVNLSNTLKVSKGYGRKVHLSAISKERIIFSLDFETEERELRSAQQVFKNCEAGSQLENVVFEIVNSKGEVDESINDEEKHGQSHTLTIKSKSLDIDDDVRHSFRHGRCTIRSIPLPQREGTFSFSAAHSRYPDLQLVIKVHVVKAREENCDSVRNHEDAGNQELSVQRSCESEEIIPHSPSLNASRAMHETSAPSSNEDVSPHSSSPALKTPKPEHTDARLENSMVLRTEASTSQDLGNFACSALICQKDLLEELENDLINSGATVFELEGKLGELRDTQSRIQKDISELQASVDGELGDWSSMCCKESVSKQIESKSETAAAVICKKLEETPPALRYQDIMGVVALLGATESIELSRMLARYLGEDQMLAIVCSSYEAAYQLEATTQFAQSMHRGYHVFCLEDIRPCCTQPTSDPQQLLNLEAPTLLDGNVAQGFLGHAVNLICIEEDDLQWRTKTGHGLRETLFYRLFGQLQVYRDRKSMMAAQSCIKDGALSLDGCIMRGNGLLSLGHWEPEVVFPVRSKAMSPKRRRALKLLEAKKSELVKINKLIDEASRSHQSAKEKFIMARDKYNSFKSANRSSSAEGSLQNCTW